MADRSGGVGRTTAEPLERREKKHDRLDMRINFFL